MRQKAYEDSLGVWVQYIAALIQVMANNIMHFDTPKHCTVNSKKYAVMFSILMKEFEIMFKIA